MKKELYVGNLSANVTEDDIRKLFSVSGTVTSIHLIRDNRTKEFKGCGYVRMSSPEEMKDAIETLDGALLLDRIIRVSEATSQPPDKKRAPAGSRRASAQGVAAFQRQKR